MFGYGIGCSECAFQTNVNGAAAVINHINTLLSTEYKPLFYTVFNMYSSRYIQNSGDVSITQRMSILSSAAGNLQAAVDDKHSRDTQLLVAFNNLDVSIQHIYTLKSHLNEYARTYDATDNNSVVQFGLVEMENTASEFIDTYKFGLDLVVNAIMFRLKSSLDEFAANTYDITESTFTERNDRNYFITLYNLFSNEILLLQKCLTTNNYNILVYQLIQQLNNRIEQIIRSKQFNFWGGLLLDAQIRQLYQYYLSLNLTDISTHYHNMFPNNINTLFNKLKQISLLLSCETVGEATDLWQNTNDTWILKLSDVKTVLKYRCDFNARDIEAIK